MIADLTSDDLTITHHLDVASLMTCSAGSQPEALGAVIASHLAVCPQCRGKLSQLSRIGEALFEALPNAAMLGSVPSHNEVTPSSTETALYRTTPALIKEHMRTLEWTCLASGVRAATLALSPQATGDLCLIELAPGASLPDEPRVAADLTFVVAGSFRDDRGTFRAGDIADFDSKPRRAPVADTLSGCVCLMASDTALIYRNSAATG